MIRNELQESVHALAETASQTRRISIRTQTHPSVSLVATVLGHDFVAGIEESSGQWWCIPQRQIVEWQSTTPFDRDTDETLPAMRIRDIDLARFVSELDLPVRLQLDDRVETIAAVQAHWLIALANKPRMISLDSVGLVRILDLPDWQLAEQLP
ncbi:MAG: hypothetical protein RLZZ164_465 [Actinomycetota bacterium]|jgi:hypothetical protein